MTRLRHAFLNTISKMAFTASRIVLNARIVTQVTQCIMYYILPFRLVGCQVDGLSECEELTNKLLLSCATIPCI